MLTPSPPTASTERGVEATTHCSSSEPRAADETSGQRTSAPTRRSAPADLADEADGQSNLAATSRSAASDWLRNEAPVRDAPLGEALPRELLAANIQTTRLTAVVRILAGRVDDPHPGSGYVNFVYRARVLETIKGEPLEEIVYGVMADRDLPLTLPPYPLIVSLCGAAESGLYIPDNGYESSAPPALVEFARGVESSSNSISSACRQAEIWHYWKCARLRGAAGKARQPTDVLSRRVRTNDR